MRYSREINELYARGSPNSSTLVEAAKANYEIHKANGTNAANESDTERNEKVSIKKGDHYIRIYKEVNISTTSYSLTNLSHYSQYRIMVRACREWEPSDEQDHVKNCSEISYVTSRTKKIGKYTIPIHIRNF